MKILVLNGSPRKGNTLAAITAFTRGVSSKHELEVVDTYKLKVSPCKGCGACQCYKGCVAKDDSNMIVDKIVEADVVVFATPVYWWGITAQMKMVIDKCYCKGALLKNKIFDNVRIVYKKEIVYGENIECYYSQHNDKYIITAKSKDKINAVIELY